ncbi:type III secretion protein [Proteus hauseri]|uniref:type III secretion protein n=1 Tax=Proteus hauseri TaxID=183417 RepID=UPI0013E9640B|nr:type III secretion protein [Proteus hauseri]
MATNISNISLKKNTIADLVSEKEDVETKKINDNILKNNEDSFFNAIKNVEVSEEKINKVKPELKKPEAEVENVQSLIEQLQNDKNLQKNNPISSSNFNFLSDEMMSIIGLMIQYLKNMIKKYESSRELGNLFMQISLDIADKMKNDLYKKADLMLGAAISSAAVSMAIHGIGAFTSIKGLGKSTVANTNTNSMMIKGTFFTSLADPISKIVDQSIQMDAHRIEGDIKVLEARTHAMGQVANNNNDIQREALDIVKALVQAMDAIIRANQDAASSIAATLRG